MECIDNLGYVIIETSFTPEIDNMKIISFPRAYLPENIRAH